MAGNHPHIGLHVAVVPNGSYSRSCRTLSNLTLKCGGDVADFIQEQGSSFGQGKTTRLVLPGVGEGAFLVAEQLRFQQRVRQALRN